MCGTESQAIVSDAGAVNSGLFLGSVSTTHSGGFSCYSLEMGQAVWKWLMTGDSLWWPYRRKTEG